MKRSIKIAVCAVVATALLVTGFSAGMLVQHKLDIRYDAAVELVRAMRLHKALAVGNYDYAQKDTMCRLMDGAMHLDAGLEFHDLPIFLRDGFTGRWDDGWHRASLAHIISMRRARPDIMFPRELQPELEAFTPCADYEHKALDFYASLDPAEH